MLARGEPPKPLLCPQLPRGTGAVHALTPALPFQGSQHAQLEQSSAEAQPLECQGLRASNMQNKGFY